MKKIIIGYIKNDKAIARKLSQFLESKGFEVWIEPRDVPAGKSKEEAFEMATKQAIVFIPIFSDEADKSDYMMKLSDKAFDADLFFIPFLVKDVKDSVAMQFFLSQNYWINAYEKTFDEAALDLIDLLENEFGDNIARKQKNKEKTINKNIDTTTENKKTKKNLVTVASVIAILAILTAIFYTESGNNTKNTTPANTSTTTDNTSFFDTKGDLSLVGKWKLVDYKDNLKRSKQDSIQLISDLKVLKKNFLLIFNKDGSFERYGFAPTVEKGKWKFDKQTSYLYLKGMNSNKQDIVSVENLTKNTFVLVVAENVNGNQVITKLYLQRTE